jgi:regulator of replication initiation timing
MQAVEEFKTRITPTLEKLHEQAKEIEELRSAQQSFINERETFTNLVSSLETRLLNTEANCSAVGKELDIALDAAEHATGENQGLKVRLQELTATNQDQAEKIQLQRKNLRDHKAKVGDATPNI